MNPADIEELTVEVVEEEEDEEASNYQFPSYILRHLNIASDGVADDPTYALQSRNITCDITCHQLLYYLSLTLKSFANKHGGNKKYPCILLIGPGFLGSRLIEKIVEINCAPILNVFTRGDIASKYWIGKGIRASNSIKKLIKKQKVDILILCTSVSAFPSIVRKLEGRISRSTAVLNASMGLPNRRIYNQWQTPSIFRVYQEPERVIKRVKEEYVRTGYSNDHPHLMTDMEGYPNIQNIEVETISNYSLSRITLTEENLSYCEYSADLLATRVGDICHLIFILENYYSLRGCPHDKARIDALAGILGYNSAQAPASISTSSEPISKKVLATPVRDQLFQNVLKSLDDNIVSTFQRQLSRYIRIVDLPKVTIESTEDKTSADEDASLIEERGSVSVHEDRVILRIFDENSKFQTKDEEMAKLLSEFESDEEEDDPFSMEFGAQDVSKLNNNPRCKVPAHVLQSAYDAYIPEFNIDDESNDDHTAENSPLKSKDASPNNSPIRIEQATGMSQTFSGRRKSVIVYGTKGIHSLNKQERDIREKKMLERATAQMDFEIGGVPLPISPRASNVSPRDRACNTANDLIIETQATATENVTLVITSYGSSNAEGLVSQKKVIEISGDISTVNIKNNLNTESSRLLNDLSVGNAGESKASRDMDIDESELLDTFV